MKILQAPTEAFVKRDRTTLSADALAGNNVEIFVVNAANFAVDDYVVIGFEGGETAELVKITARTATSITATLLLAHAKDQPVTQYRYNQRKFYGCLTATGTFAQLTSSGSPVTIMVNDPQGTVLEYTGTEGYLYFKSTYFNSTTSDETNIADAEAILGDESARYCTLYAIRKQAGLTNNPFIAEDTLETYRRRAENEINSYLFNGFDIPLTDSAGDHTVPFIIENCATLLAAGYMDYQEFGKDGEGVKWLGEARSLLKAIQNNKQRLIDAYGLEYAQKDAASTIQSYPDQVDNDNGPAQYFTMSQRF